MKKKLDIGLIFIIIVIVLFIFLSYKAKKIEKTKNTTETIIETTTESTTEITTEAPIVSYSDIKSGIYNDKFVKIEGIITDIENIKIISDINVNVWIKDGNRFIDDGVWFIDDEDIGIDNYTYLSQNLKIGDNCIFTTAINSDGSISSTRIKNVEITGNNTTIEEIKKIYISQCINITGIEIARNPEQYKDTDLSLKGEVFQLVDESNNNIEFLLDTGGDNGIVYVSYTIPGGENRILVGDYVTIYGRYNIMKSYRSVLGTKQNVPSVSAKFLI